MSNESIPAKILWDEFSDEKGLFSNEISGEMYVLYGFSVLGKMKKMRAIFHLDENELSHDELMRWDEMKFFHFGILFVHGRVW